MVHQFDARMYTHCLNHQPVQQQQHVQHHQPLNAGRQYTADPSRSTAADYVMYTGSGNTAVGGDIVARSPTSACHQTLSYVTDAAVTSRHHQTSSLMQQQQQHIYYNTDYRHHQLSSKCASRGSGENGLSTCLAYPSVTGTADEGNGSTVEWSATVGQTFSDYMSGDDSLDLLHQQLLNPDKTSLSDNVYVYPLPSCKNPASAAVTMVTGPTSKYRLPPEPDAAGTVSVVKQHLNDIDSRNHHIPAGEAAWTQSEPTFGWMKKQIVSPVTLTGTHAC